MRNEGGSPTESPVVKSRSVERSELSYSWKMTPIIGVLQRTFLSHVNSAVV